MNEFYRGKTGDDKNEVVWMGEEKKDRSDGSRDVRVVEGSRDVRVGVSLAALIRGHRRLRHRPTTLHFFYTQTECFVECREYIVFLHYIIAQCTGAADIVQLYFSSTQVRQSTIALHCIALHCREVRVPLDCIALHCIAGK